MSKKYNKISNTENYDTIHKSEYRTDVHNPLSQIYLPELKTNPELKILILPSNHDLEIKELLTRGVKQEQIICINNKEEKFEESEWRYDYPRITRHLCNASEVGIFMEEDGMRLVSANLDLCNEPSWVMVEELQNFFLFTPFHSTFRVAINLCEISRSAFLKEFDYDMAEYPQFKSKTSLILYDLITNTIRDNIFRREELRVSYNFTEIYKTNPPSSAPMEYSIFTIQP